MKRLTIIIAVFSGFLSISYAQDKIQTEKTTESAKVENYTFCPVTREKVIINGNTPKAEYNGKTYYFCCINCLEKFNKEPAKYSKKNSSQS